jgi:hypothetical protein
MAGVFEVEAQWERFTYASIATFVQGYEEEQMIKVLERAPAWKRANALWTALEVIRILAKAEYSPGKQVMDKLPMLESFQRQLDARMKEPSNAQV